MGSLGSGAASSSGAGQLVVADGDHAGHDERAAQQLHRQGQLAERSQANSRLNSTSVSPTNEATLDPSRRVAATPAA